MKRRKKTAAMVAGARLALVRMVRLSVDDVAALNTLRASCAAAITAIDKVIGKQ